MDKGLPLGKLVDIKPTIYLHVPKTEIYKKSVFYYGAALWNALPPEIWLCENIDNYKNKLYQIVL